MTPYLPDDTPLATHEQAMGWVEWTLAAVALGLLAAVVILPLYFGTR